MTLPTTCSAGCGVPVALGNHYAYVSGAMYCSLPCWETIIGNCAECGQRWMYGAGASTVEQEGLCADCHQQKHGYHVVTIVGRFSFRP